MTLVVKNPPAIAGDSRDPGQEDPLEQEMATHSRTLAQKAREWRRLLGCSPWGHKEPDTTERLHLPLSEERTERCGPHTHGLLLSRRNG